MISRKEIMRRVFFYAQVSLPLLFISHAHAVEQFIRFEGTLIEPVSCVYNDGGSTEVNFGSDILSRKIDGENYSREFKVKFDCAGLVTNDIRMRFYGGGPDFDTKAVGLTMKDIGVAIYNGSKRIGVSEWNNITAMQTYTYKAVLVKKKDAVIPGGSFSGYVNILVDYR